MYFVSFAIHINLLFLIFRCSVDCFFVFRIKHFIIYRIQIRQKIHYLEKGDSKRANGKRKHARNIDITGEKEQPWFE